ncbi:hypothetical protein C0J52_15152 [Blattella germanica]|nr:hypothetical protein C0J52_15152 [Blattella germanica]
MNKAELVELVKLYKPRFCTYEIETIAAANGHTVIRLPPYHCHFNPIELIWAQVKGYVAANNKTFRIADVERLVEHGIEQVTVEKWQSALRHTWEIILDAKKAEGVLEGHVEELVITLDANNMTVKKKVISTRTAASFRWIINILNVSTSFF